MISEGSCDNEDWSNDAEKSALYNSNKLHFKLLKQNTTVFTFIFDQLILLTPNIWLVIIHKKIF